jgi:hypothetical protein
MDAFIFALAMAAYAGMAAAVAASRRGRMPARLWRLVAPIVLLHVTLVWAWRYEWELGRALRNGWTAFIVFHAAALTVAASLWAGPRLASIMVRGAFLISTAGALGAVFRRPEVAFYRAPVVACALLGLGSLALACRDAGRRPSVGDRQGAGGQPVAGDREDRRR